MGVPQRYWSLIFFCVFVWFRLASYNDFVRVPSSSICCKSLRFGINSSLNVW